MGHQCPIELKGLKAIKANLKTDLIKILSEPKPKINLSKKKIKEIKKDFGELRCRFSKSKIKEFRRSFYNIKNQKNLSTPEIKETDTMHTKRHDIEIILGSETDEIIKILFESLLQNYQKDLEESMRGSKSVFDGIDLLYYHL